MSESSQSYTPDELPAVPSPPLQPLSILTEEDIAALPPTPSSYSSPCAADEIDTNDEDHPSSGAEDHAATPHDPLSYRNEEPEVSLTNEEINEESAPRGRELMSATPSVTPSSLSGNDNDTGEAQVPVDSPLAKPESLSPPSTSTASPWPPAPSAFPIASAPPIIDLPATAPAAGGRENCTDAACMLTVVGSGRGSKPRDDDETGEAAEVEATAAGEATFSEEDIATSIRLSEEEATAALSLFSTSLHAKLLEQLIDDAAVAVEQTLFSTIRQHGARVRALVAHNEALDAKLTSQAAEMQRMQQEMEETMLRDVQRILRVDLRATLRAQSSTSSLPLVLSPPCDDGHKQQQQQQKGGSNDVLSQHENEEDTRENVAAAQPVSVDELVAAYLGTRGTIEVLQRERAAWRENLSLLQSKLLAATQENAQLRREVEHLRTTTVDLEVHRTAVQAHEEAEHKCVLLQLQLAKQAEEAETLLALLERHALTQSGHNAEATTTVTTAVSPSSSPAAAAGVVDHTSHSIDRANVTYDGAVRKGPVWDAAVRELEAQAALAASSCHLQVQLDEAAAAVKRLELERDASAAYAADLKKEGDVLRADAQSLVYRNGVLSQQVASLLVKVEKTTRAYKRLKENATRQEEQQLLTDGCRSSSTHNCKTSRDRTLVPSGLLQSLPTTASRRSNWLASRWLSTSANVAATSSVVPTLPPFTSTLAARASTASSPGHSLNTAALHDQSPSSDFQQLLYMPNASADVSFIQGPCEVEEGVQQRLATYSASHVAVPSTLLAAAAATSAHHGHLCRSRQTSLRQLGSAMLEVQPTSAPRLPASDQLSGSALGRPSAYFTLDPLNGTVTRRVGRNEVSVAQKDGVGGASSSLPASVSSAIASVDDVNEDSQLLSMLDMLDKDESLDRFSVNSVSELVVRNQELVKQLYEATQRAEVAEREQQQLKHNLLEAEKLRSTAPLSENQAQQQQWYDQLPASLATPTTALLHHAETAARLQSRNADGPSRKRDRDDADYDVDARASAQAQQQQSRGSNGLLQRDRVAIQSRPSSFFSAPSLESEKGTDNSTEARSDAATAAVVEPWFIESASTAVTSMVDALVRRHQVRLTAVDTNVSRALLRALVAQRVADSAAEPYTSCAEASSIGPFVPPLTEEESTPAPSRVMAVCLRTLLQLCVRQSAALAEVALDAAGQQQELQQAVKETWTGVQETLLQALRTSHIALTDSSNGTKTTSSNTTNNGSCSAETLVASSLQGAPQLQGGHNDDFTVEEQVTLLQELSTLLQTAAKKDGTLLHVYQAAQARQEARQHKQKERLARLLLKLERKRRLIKAMRLRQVYVGKATNSMNVDTAAACGLSHAGQDVDKNNITNAQSTGVGAGVGGFRLSPQPGSPVRRTPPLPPMSLPSATVPSSPQSYRRLPTADNNTVNSGHERDIGADAHTDHTDSQRGGRSDDESGSGSDETDIDDDAVALDTFRELQQQLSFSQATHRAVQAELDEEKRKHTQMLERMWVLETACDDATAAKETLEKRVEAMVPRDAYESLENELKKAMEGLKSRDAQLSNAAAEHYTLQEQLAALKTQREAEQLQLKTQYAQLEEVARRREQRLLREEDRYRELHAQMTELKQHAAGLENTIALARRELQDKTQVISEREVTIEELKSDVLMREDSQAVLCRLFPGDSALQANAQLVQRLSKSTARLQLELSEVKQDLAHAQNELRRRELQVREAVQDRQAAEVRLQDAVARLAELQDDDFNVTDNNPRNSSSNDQDDSEEATLSEQQRRREESAPESPNSIQSPTLTNIDALLSNVGCASVAALRHRVHYLTTRMEAQASDLAVMRGAEAAWKTREEDLRRQLELLSADPISHTARKYGLTACANFADQIAEMQARQDALHTLLTATEEEKTKLAAEVAAAVKKATETEQQRADVAAHARRLDEQLAAVRAESQNDKAKMALLTTQLEEAQVKQDHLHQQHQQALADLHDATSKLRDVQTSLETCREQRDQFLVDNKQMIGAVEKLEKALLQSESEKVMAREALAQGLSSAASTSRRHRGGAGGDRGHRSMAVERYQNQTSLTQDLSFSSTPSP